MKNTLIFEYSAWFILVCLLLAFAYAFFLYFRDKKIKELSKNKIYLLASLRFLSTFIISLLLLSPLLKSVNTIIEKPLIIFANDNSESILLASKENEAEVENYKNSITGIYEKVIKKYNSIAFSFGDKFEENLIFNYTAKQTNIAEVFNKISTDYYNKNIGALVLITDGIYTDGANPLYNTENLMFPVYTVALGDTSEYMDLFIKDLMHNEIAFIKNKFPLEITITAKKMKGKTAKCEIFHNGKVIFSQNFEINNNDFLYKTTTFIEAQKAGVQQYQVVLTKIQGEKNTKNNSSFFAINVIEDKQKILILAHSPHPDISAIVNSLKSNFNFETDFYLAEGFNKKISDYSLVILHQLPSKTNSLTKIFQDLINEKIPVLFIIGTQTDIAKLNTLNLGFTIQQKTGLYDDAQGYVNTEFSDFNISKNLNDLLFASPPLTVPFGDYKFPANFKIIAYQRVKNINTIKPLITYSSSTVNYESNIGVILGEGIWRWRMTDYKKNSSFDIFDNTFNQIIQSLVLKESKERLSIKVDKIIRQNENIVFKAEAYNKIMELTNENDLKLTIKDSTGKTFEYLMQKNMSSYFLDIGTLPVGNYSFYGSTKIADETLSSAGTFNIVSQNVEAVNLVANHSLLYNISKNTGGKLLYINNIDSLEYYLENDENIVPVSYSNYDLNELLKYKWIFFLILSIISIEWFLRKFFGTY